MFLDDARMHPLIVLKAGAGHFNPDHTTLNQILAYGLVGDVEEVLDEGANEVAVQ